MDTGIGATLREARNRRKVDLSEVEAAIKIRVRYLQAMEGEQWDVLPGGAYTRGFIRTYASYLGLDGERLAEDYRQSTAPPGGERAPKRIEPVPAAARRRHSRVPAWATVAVVCAALAAIVVGIGLAGGGGSSSPSPGRGPAKESHHVKGQGGLASRPGVVMQLVATGEVWVCVLGADRTPLVDGQILEAGAQAGPFRSASFEIALGNGSANVLVDGNPAHTPPSSSPVGYRVDSSGRLSALEEGERPECR